MTNFIVPLPHLQPDFLDQSITPSKNLNHFAESSLGQQFQKVRPKQLRQSVALNWVVRVVKCSWVIPITNSPGQFTWEKHYWVVRINWVISSCEVSNESLHSISAWPFMLPLFAWYFCRPVLYAVALAMDNDLGNFSTGIFIWSHFWQNQRFGGQFTLQFPQSDRAISWQTITRAVSKLLGRCSPMLAITAGQWAMAAAFCAQTTCIHHAWPLRAHRWCALRCKNLSLAVFNCFLLIATYFLVRVVLKLVSFIIFPIQAGESVQDGTLICPWSWMAERSFARNWRKGSLTIHKEYNDHCHDKFRH